MGKSFGDKVADALRARAQDRDTFENIVRALDSYMGRERDGHLVTRVRRRGRAELSYKGVDVCSFYVRKGKIIVHPTSGDAEQLVDVDAALGLMAILLADVIADQDDAAEGDWANAATIRAGHARKGGWLA